jgi:uncharacterized OB-fold protein
MSDDFLSKQRSIPAPQPNPETQAFWSAAEEGRFLIKACRACGRAHWYPRAVCPFCASEDTEWRAGSGFGTIYAFSPMRQAPEPYILAYVTLEEGPAMLTNLVGCQPEALHIGQRVAVKFLPTDDGPPVPVFTPC